MRLFIFGYGYSASAFVERVRGRCSWIGATTRSSDKAATMTAAGVAPFLFDGTARDAATAEALRQASHVLISIGPDANGDPVLRHYRDDLSAARPQWTGYLSTVGVYGNHDGAWVDEETPCRPVSRRSVQRLAAEDAWLDWAKATGLPVEIFRLAGIYGPGRNAFVNFDKGTARRLVKPGQVFNRIHVADIAGALEAAIDTPSATRIYNVTDDEPAPPQDVVAYAAQLLGRTPPPEQDFETAELTPMARSFYGENKRVSNARLKRELGYAFRFPNYRQALEALYRDGWR
ncbi:SDR family oxidoreductase [Stappia taiwanensis]|uniref:SDR family oxidoreductase n=1 Tax=Stappia taiwanensis TaxID=992267 RepID=A0A838Y1J6_9HYPH|nr:SDR family oxidoreductase [Stappia taiwanensis]MBA4612820.1 SDR family oxidoreductase [Stappia taiwanensis]GGE89767.1 NAD(P)-dependent oxidoreductase [Stappia taiwanensis]